MHIKQSSIFRRNSFLRELLRAVFTKFHFHKPGPKKDILVLSVARSGSTWFMELLSRDPGLNYINEPNNERFIRRGIAKDIIEDEDLFMDNVLFHIPPKMESALREYLLEPQHTAISSPYNVVRKNYHLFTDRRVLKVINVNPCLEYFLDLGMINLYLLRHPVSTIMSNIRGHWKPKISQYLRNPFYLENFLSNALLEKALEIQKSGSIYQKWSLAWSLSQYPAWLFFQRKNSTEKMPAGIL